MKSSRCILPELLRAKLINHGVGVSYPRIQPCGRKIRVIWRIRKHARHRCEVADIAVDDAEQRGDGSLIGGDAVQVAHLNLTVALLARDVGVTHGCLDLQVHRLQYCHQFLSFRHNEVSSLFVPKSMLLVVRSHPKQRFSLPGRRPKCTQAQLRGRRLFRD